MAHYIQHGNSIRVIGSGDIQIDDKLPVANYIIQVTPQQEYYLERVEQFQLPSKLYGKVHRHTQRIIDTFHQRELSTGVLLTGEKGSGKALRVDQLTYTTRGEKRIGDIIVGDKIYGADGKLTTVIGMFPQGTRGMFEVIFNDGSVVIADGDHLWSVKQTTRSQSGFSKQQIVRVDGKRVTITKNKILTTNQIRQALDVGVKHVIPLCDPIEFPESDISIDRYLIGVLIGDGHLRYSSPTISTSDEQIVEQISQVLKEDYWLHRINDSTYDYRICQKSPVNNGGENGMAPNWYTYELKKLGLWGKLSHEKFIPTQLKYDSVENRFALLQGLMDTDGTISKRGGMTFTTVSQQLANDFVWLARSLGFRSSIQHARKPTYAYKGVKKIGQLAYTVQLTGTNNDNVFRLDRKKKRIKKCSSCTKTIVDINQIDTAEAVCILVDNENHLFVTNDFTVTHNTMLAKNISTKLAMVDIPTLIINTCLVGDDFNKFIQSIDQPCVILFDEFEKIYDSDKQDRILTLLDGVFPTKKLFILTTNDTYRINSHMRNRPGRLFYSIDYEGLEDEFIREYCEDVLINKSYTNDLCKLSMLFSAFNFDMLKAIVEEMNRYNESPAQVLEMLNAVPDDRDGGVFDVELIINGEITNDVSIQYGLDADVPIKAARVSNEDLDDGGIWTGNPMRPRGFSLDYKNPNYDSDAEDSDYWITAEFTPSDFIRADSITGTFEFKNPLGCYVKLTRRKQTRYQYHAF